METELEGEEDEKRLLTEQILELEEQRFVLIAICMTCFLVLCV